MQPSNSGLKLTQKLPGRVLKPGPNRSDAMSTMKKVQVLWLCNIKFFWRTRLGQILGLGLGLGLALFALVGCLEDRKESAVQASSSSWFEGVLAAQNLAGAPPAIKVTWAKSDRTVFAFRIYTLIEDPISHLTSWVQLDEVSSDITSMVHSNLNSGQVYSYKVMAVDMEGVEDGNNKTVSTIAFEGISGLTITGTSTARVTLNSGSGAFDEVRVYATPKSGGAKKLVGSARGNVSSINLTGLRSGTTYQISAVAYMAYLNAEDGNNTYIEGQTYSDSFGSGVPADTDFAYRGVMNVQAFGLAPNAPQAPTSSQDPNFATNFPGFLRNPQERIVRLTWLPFVGANSTTRYRVLRVADTNSFQVNTTTACTSSLNTTCVVCTVTGSNFCEDLNVAAPPKKYDYIITQIKQDSVTSDEWVEELPKINSNDFRISVHIPPDYMVLVQRDAANYEMCSTMTRASNPRKNQRCPYVGIGATPYNSGPNKPPRTMDSGYYDFGYNLFVDRYRMACNWTNTPGACGKPEGCINLTSTNATHYTVPDAGMGNDGDVLFSLQYVYSSCWIKKGGVWKSNWDGGLTSSDLDKMTTIDPGPIGAKHRPNLTGVTATSGFGVCNSKETEYGKKRLFRRREHLVSAALPIFQGEPNSLGSISGRNSMESAALGVSAYQCNINSSSMPPIPTSTTQMVDPANTVAKISAYGTQFPTYSAPYYIGTTSTIRCQTRWGAQDQVSNNYGTPFSDVFTRTNGLTTYPVQIRGEVPDLDPGNKDMVGIEYGTGMATNLPNIASATGQSTALSGNFAAANLLGNYFIPPLGLHISSWPGTTQQDLWNYLDLAAAGTFGSAGFDIYQYPIARNSLFEMPRGRWGQMIFVDPASANYHSSLWCALEAE